MKTHWSIRQTKERKELVEELSKRIKATSFADVIDFALRYTLANFPDNPERTEKNKE